LTEIHVASPEERKGRGQVFMHLDLVFKEQIVIEKGKFFFQNIIQLDGLGRLLLVVDSLLDQKLQHPLESTDLTQAFFHLLLDLILPRGQHPLEEFHLHGQDLKGAVEVVDDSLQKRTKGGGSVGIDESREEFLGLQVKNGFFARIGAGHRNKFLSRIGIPIPFLQRLFFLYHTPRKNQPEINSSTLPVAGS
jgi:hypothetical protein